MTDSATATKPVDPETGEITTPQDKKAVFVPATVFFNPDSIIVFPEGAPDICISGVWLQRVFMFQEEIFAPLFLDKARAELMVKLFSYVLKKVPVSEEGRKLVTDHLLPEVEEIVRELAEQNGQGS